MVEHSRQLNDRGGCRSIPLRRIGRAIEEDPHLRYLLSLRLDDGRSEGSDPRILGVHDIFSHVDGALVMKDHELREEPVELRSLRIRQLLHLLVGEHAGHAVSPVLSHGVHAGHHRHAPLLEPCGHLVDLRLLSALDLRRELLDLRAGCPCLRQRRHLHGLLVVGDHHLREHRVGSGCARRARRACHAHVVHVVRAAAAR